jgi:hypothetical protein
MESAILKACVHSKNPDQCRVARKMRYTNVNDPDRTACCNW